MNKIKPVLTEKSLDRAELGQYTFFIPATFTKFQARKLIEDTFGVNTVSIKSANLKGIRKRNIYGKWVNKKSKKKVIVTLKKDQKIDLFISDKK